MTSPILPCRGGVRDDRGRLFLSCQGELDGETEVVGGGRIARRGEQRGVGLGVVVGGEGEEARKGVVGHEGELEEIGRAHV